VNKHESQYLFTDETTNILSDILISDFGADKVLCLGCPTLHGHLFDGKKAPSLLLDIDERFVSHSNFLFPSKKTLPNTQFPAHGMLQ
jgi:hypothetical protein